MRRQCVIPPTVKSHPEEEEEEDVTSAVTEHLVKTVLDQGKHVGGTFQGESIWKWEVEEWLECWAMVMLSNGCWAMVVDQFLHRCIISSIISIV